MGSGSVLRARRMPRPPTIAVLLGAVLAVSPVAAHGLVSLGLVAPADCPDGEVCLTTREDQPRLHAGETVDVNAYNDDDRRHRLHVAVEGSLPSDRANTSPERALVSTRTLEPGGSQAVGELAIPADAEALYVWCSIDDHQAEGEGLLVAVDSPHASEGRDEVPGLGPGLAALALALAAGRRRRTA